MIKLIKAMGIMVLASFVIVACSRVPQGQVGVKVYTLGNNKGPDEELLSMGRYWIPPTQELHLFPIYTQNYVWTRDPAEGSKNDESITFQDSQGLVINTDIGIEFDIDPDKVLLLFVKYRREIDEVIDGPLRNTVRDSFVNHGAEMSIESIYGGSKTKLLKLVERDVRERFAPFGINVQKVYWIGEMRIPDSVRDGITAKVRSTQLAIQRENELRQAEAEAAKKVAEAEGLAAASIARAKGESEAIKLEGEALRQYPEVLEQQAIQKWDGTLPKVVMGEDGATPFISIPMNAK